MSVTKVLNSNVIQFCCLRLQPGATFPQFHVIIKVLSRKPGLHCWEQVVVSGCKVRTVRWMWKHLPLRNIQDFSKTLDMRDIISKNSAILVSIVKAFLTGQGHFRRHLTKISFYNNECLCRLCSPESATSEHILSGHVALVSKRKRLLEVQFQEVAKPTRLDATILQQY
ncbi:hypothetical protein J6590_093524 [Homalodisca vitripennis]|nr:hypothetical protein J6590_093524 [Homalodisca vitripennis]